MAVLKLEQPAMPGVTLVKGFLGSVRRKEGSESTMKAAEEIIAAAAAILLPGRRLRARSDGASQCGRRDRRDRAARVGHSAA
jgi:hypothetical protein